MRFYKKELVSNRLYTDGGAPIAFVNIGDDTGILKTENDYLIDQLDMAVARSVGGVIPITEEVYVDLEKKSTGNLLPLNLQPDRFSLSSQTLAAGLRPHLENAVVGDKPKFTSAPPAGFDTPRETPPKLEVTTEFAKPVVKRAYRKRDVT